MIKRALLALTVVVVLGAAPAHAQKVELTPFIGYQFGGKASLINGDMKVNDAMNFGGIVDFTVRPGGQVEISYTRQNTQLQWRPFSGVGEDIDMAVDYWQIGGLGYVMKGDARPFLSFTLGATHFIPKENTINERTIDDEWRFSFVLGLGAKYFPSQRVGFRFAGHLYSTFLDTNSSIWCGVPTGCSLGFFGAGIFQVDVQAGLVIGLGD